MCESLDYPLFYQAMEENGTSCAEENYHYRDKYQNKLGRPKDDEFISTDQERAKKSGLLKIEYSREHISDHLG